jgi:hypothetical protein
MESRSNRIVRKPRALINNSSSYISILPDDIKNIFLNEMNCNELRKLKLNPEFSRLITQNMINKAVNRGYPRKRGKATFHVVGDIKDAKELEPYYKIYDIFDSNSDTSIAYEQVRDIIKRDKLDNEFQNELEELLFIKHRSSSVANLTVHNKIKQISKELMQNYQIEDLVKGDIIYVRIKGFEGLSLIYDGCNFTEIDSMPEQFKVLENGVPIDYWTGREGDLLPGINNININILPYRNEILNNLKYNERGNSSFMSSSFIINGKEYRIKFYNDDEDEVIDLINENSELSVEYKSPNLLEYFY